MEIVIRHTHYIEKGVHVVALHCNGETIQRNSFVTEGDALKRVIELSHVLKEKRLRFTVVEVSKGLSFEKSSSEGEMEHV